MVFTTDSTSADLPSGGTITYTRHSSGAQVSMAAFCIQGTDGNAAAVVGTPGDATVSSSPATTSVTGTGCAAGQIVVGLCAAIGVAGPVAWTNPSGWTQPFTHTNGSASAAALIGGYQTEANSTETYSPTFTFSTGAAWASLMLVYNAAGVTASLAAGSFAETGETLTGIVGLTATYGSVAETGEVSTYGFTAALSTGTYTLTGEAATFQILTGTVMAAGFGSFAETGKAATFAEAGPLAVGTFAETGIAATFTITTGAFVVCAAGMFAETGEAATFVSGVSVFPFGRYALTGEAAAFAIGTIWTVQPAPSTVWTNEVG